MNPLLIRLLAMLAVKHTDSEDAAAEPAVSALEALQAKAATAEALAAENTDLKAKLAQMEADAGPLKEKADKYDELAAKAGESVDMKMGEAGPPADKPEDAVKMDALVKFSAERAQLRADAVRFGLDPKTFDAPGKALGNAAIRRAVVLAATPEAKRDAMSKRTDAVIEAAYELLPAADTTTRVDAYSELNGTDGSTNRTDADTGDDKFEFPSLVSATSTSAAFGQ